jgi:cystathionine gamma-synthase
LRIDTKAVHAGERGPAPKQTPVVTPIHTAASFVTSTQAELDRIFGAEEKGFAYQRYTNPTNEALEEQITALENGFGSLACASGMSALWMAITTALLERPKMVLYAEAIYGASIKLLVQVMEPYGVRSAPVDTCDLKAVARALDEHKPGALLMETISNPLLRVSAIDEIAKLCRASGTALIVDSTFATPVLVRPLELGAHLVVHSLTKYFAGHGDVLGGVVVSDEAHFETLRRLSRVAGSTLGPFESYLTQRGVKTMPLRMERQCSNARKFYEWLSQHPRIARACYPSDPRHPDAAIIARLLPHGLYGGMVSFDLKDAHRAEAFAFLDRLKMTVCATSLGDVHTMALYPWISSHREVTPELKARTGVTESLIRVSVGIEAIEDIIADFAQALG